MRTTYDLKNLADHGVTRGEVDQVLRSGTTAEFDLSPSQRGNERMMLVGFTGEGRLLEVGIEFFLEESRMHVFHADDAGKPYQIKFERAGKTVNKKANISKQARKMLEQARKDAHERVVKRGLIQFRAEEELVDQLLQIADHKKIPVSVLVRSWVAEHVRQEFPLVPVRKITLPDGRVLTQDSCYRELEEAHHAYNHGKLPLNAREVRTLDSWLFDRHGTDQRTG